MSASRIHHRRIDCHKTQLAIALAAGISSGRFSLIERELVEPSPDERQRIANVLGTSEDALFGEAACGTPEM